MEWFKKRNGNFYYIISEWFDMVRNIHLTTSLFACSKRYDKCRDERQQSENQTTTTTATTTPNDGINNTTDGENGGG